MAYTQVIGNNEDSHQASPAYVLTFIRFSNRDVYNYTNVNNLETREPLVVVNDAVSISIQNTKSNPNPTLSCILKQGDLNYLTAVNPGDFVIVNLVNWETKAMEIRGRALESRPINKHTDGFKGLFKILDVNMNLAVDANGEKQYYVQVTARGFDEFNNILYFNPALIQELSTKDKSGILFTSSFSNFADLVQRRDTSNVQELVKTIIQRTIGQGFTAPGKPGLNLNQVPIYSIPTQVAKLLNIPSAKYVADINKYYLGIWGGMSANSKPNPFYSGFYNFFKEYDGQNKEDSTKSFFKTGQDLQGSRQVSFQDFQSVNVWSLLQDYSNPTINESYTCYRVAPDRHVYPSVVVRQKPFNTRHYESKGPISTHTKYLDLPSWKISPDLILSLNIGRSDQGRINFVQVFSRALSIDAQFDAALQISSGNFVEDKLDVVRHGRKPYIVTCNFAPPESEKNNAKAREWAYLVSDWLFDGHLKLNGTMQTAGIEEPICVGDNIELDSVVYHIESISHSMNISANGVKVFRTNLSLSMGVDKRSTSTIPVYGEMDYTDSFTRRKDDFNKEKLLPGFSDSQDWPGRRDGEEVSETSEASFTNPKAPLNLKNKGNKS
jgi:hypothetical protein